MFRHAYGTDMQLRQLEPNVDIALRASRSVKQDIAKFLENLTNLTEGSLGFGSWHLSSDSYPENHYRDSAISKVIQIRGAKRQRREIKIW